MTKKGARDLSIFFMEIDVVKGILYLTTILIFDMFIDVNFAFDLYKVYHMRLYWYVSIGGYHFFGNDFPNQILQINTAEKAGWVKHMC